MENSSPPAAKRSRIPVEQEKDEELIVADQRQRPALSDLQQARSKQRRLCNELVFEICRSIPAARTSYKILYSSSHIQTYLVPRFRKRMELIYAETIAFIRGVLDSAKNVNIQIDNLIPNDESEHRMIYQRKLAYGCELITNQMRIKARVGSLLKRSKTECRIYGIASFENPHLLCFVRLVAPLMRPVKLCVYLRNHDRPIKPSAVLFLSPLLPCFDWVQLSAEYFFSKQLCPELAKHGRLRIGNTNTGIGLNTWPQFCRGLIRCLTANDQSKQCVFALPFFSERKLNILLDEVKAEFSQSDATHQFEVHFSSETVVPLSEFTLDNSNGEVLELRESAKVKIERASRYTLRRFAKSLDNEEQQHLELPNFSEFSDIQLM